MNDITDDLFHYCALMAYVMAQAEGKERDSNYVKQLAYELYERELRENNNR